MAVGFLAHEVSDLCIGKPPLTPLPPSATVGEALLSLKQCGESSLSVWAESSPTDKGSAAAAACVGKVCMVDVICYLCTEENLANPAAALSSPVSALLAEGSAGLVKLVQRHSSVLEALDVILDGAQGLLVPLRARGGAAGRRNPLCWLTPEEFVRFFLGSIGAFSPAGTLSVDALGLVRTDAPAIRHEAPALSAVPLLKAALASQTAVAVVTADGKLVGEISPPALAGCDESLAAAVATLSAGELVAYLACGGDPPEEAVEEVRARLRERGFAGLLGLLEEGGAPSDGGSLSSLSSGGSSGSSSDEEAAAPPRACRRGRRRGRSVRGRTEGTVVCRRESSLVAVMIQALAHRVGYVWVVEEDYELAGVVTFADVLGVFRELLKSF